jgi:hypothetical protein
MTANNVTETENDVTDIITSLSGGTRYERGVDGLLDVREVAEMFGIPFGTSPTEAPTDISGSPDKRRRATKAEMETRRELVIGLALEHGPCSVRHLFYQAVVARVPGITKNDSGYNKVQLLVLELRRAGLIPYSLIVDSTRWQRGPRTWGSVQEALDDTARLYRRDLWRSSPWRVEVWCESDSIASTITEPTYRWGVPLMVTRGFSSETFAFNAAETWQETPDRTPVVLYVGDHDPHGLDIERKLEERLGEFTEDTFTQGFHWFRLGVTWEQVKALDLPGTTPKRSYGFPLAVEAEALPPQMLVEIVDNAIESYVDDHEIMVLRAAEESERDLLWRFAEQVGA